jgi:flagellar motor switch protein FliG
MARPVKKREGDELDGRSRAAILLMALGEKPASEIIKHLTPKEVQLIGIAIANIKTVSRQEVTATLEDFLTHVIEQTPLGIGTEEYLRNALGMTLGKEKAQSLINRILSGQKLVSGIESLGWMDAEAIARVLRNEHPQIIAIVIAHLESEQAAEVLALMPDAKRADLIRRIATLGSVPPSALSELNAIIDEKVADNPNIPSEQIGGVGKAADILNRSKSSVGTEILDQIMRKDPNLGTALDEALFTFDDIAKMSDHTIQNLLREINSATLVTALKGAGEALKEKFLGNMSKRAGDLLRDDLEAKGPTRISEVEAAQGEIVAIARSMAETSGLGGSDEFI